MLKGIQRQLFPGISADIIDAFYIFFSLLNFFFFLNLMLDFDFLIGTVRDFLFCFHSNPLTPPPIGLWTGREATLIAVSSHQTFVGLQ